MENLEHTQKSTKKRHFHNFNFPDITTANFCSGSYYVKFHVLLSIYTLCIFPRR